jgi:hypothetical protein
MFVLMTITLSVSRPRERALICAASLPRVSQFKGGSPFDPVSSFWRLTAGLATPSLSVQLPGTLISKRRIFCEEFLRDLK